MPNTTQSKLTYVIDDPNCCSLLTAIISDITYKSSAEELMDLIRIEYDAGSFSHYWRKFINFKLKILLVKK